MDPLVSWLSVDSGDAVPHRDGSRFDFHCGVHKAVRAMMADALLAVGRMDASDPAEVGQVCQRISLLMDLCTAHTLRKRRLLHAAIEARAPGTSDLAARGCRHQAREFAGLRAMAQTLRGSPQSLRTAAAARLYRGLALLVAENFQRMHLEESAYNVVLWSNYSDEELAGLHGELMASVALDEAYALHWLLPCMNPAERLFLLSRMEAGARGDAFENTLSVARARLAPGEWRKLACGLGLIDETGGGVPRKGAWDDAGVMPIRDARVLEALRAIHQHPARAWTVASLARLCHLSRTAFTMRFRRQTLLPPMTYLANWRVELAARMLREERLSLDEVAERVGYSSGAILARAYKRILGAAPRIHLIGSGGGQPGGS